MSNLDPGKTSEFEATAIMNKLRSQEELINQAKPKKSEKWTIITIHLLVCLFFVYQNNYGENPKLISLSSTLFYIAILSNIYYQTLNRRLNATLTIIEEQRKEIELLKH